MEPLDEALPEIDDPPPVPYTGEDINDPDPVMTSSTTTPKIVVFDLGGVLIDWNPRYLYRTVFTTEAEVEDFLAQVALHEWNLELDRGRAWAETAPELKTRFPHFAEALDAFHDRWPETLGGSIDGTVAILAALDEAGVPLYALTNWSAETFHHARERFAFLDRFRDILVSGVERLVKPDPEIYRRLAARNGFALEDAVFIDDNAANVAGARAVGMQAIRFTSPGELAAELRGLGVAL
jgi:2-haloacid dehalogenase